MRTRTLSIITGLALGALALAAPLGDKLNLVRKFKIGETETYSIDAQIGADMNFKGKLSLKASATPDKKPSEVEVKILLASMEMGGQPNEMPLGDPKKETIDAGGFPSEFVVADSDMVTANRKPKTNALYWHTKFEQNRERDVRNAVALEELGFRVLALWECEVTEKRLGEAVERVRLALGRE